MRTRSAAILIFDDVEVLDFAGPFEVFNVANIISNGNAFNVHTAAENENEVIARNGLKIIPDYSLQNCPQPDILIVPGGEGRKTEMYNPVVIDWVKKKSEKAEYVLSVCTGAFIIGKAGLLKGMKATTHHLSYDEFEKTFPDTELVKGVKYTDNGKVIAAAGISAGINMSLYTVDKILGEDSGRRTAEHMEYDY